MIIELPHEVSIYIEKLFYQYNASLSILSYLLKQEDINEIYLNKYIEKSERLNIELEEAKKRVSKQYYPEELKEEKCNYSFDFDQEIIKYEVVS